MISLQFLLTAFVGCVALGTVVICTLALGLGQGRRAAIAAAAGCTFGVARHLAAATLALAALLNTSALLFQVMKFASVAYLLYLAWQALKSICALSVRPDGAARRIVKITQRGTLANILKPKLSIFFLALLPQILSSNSATVTTEMVLLGAIFMIMSFVIFLFCGVFAAFVRDRLLQSEKIILWLNRSFAGIFAALGLTLAFEKA
jgi:threonine/homoserine/homoserine lactone efflux protein